MNSLSEKTLKIIDSSTLYDSIARQSLRIDLLHLSTFHRILLIPHVRVTTEKNFADQEKLLRYFKRLIDDLKEQGVIETNPKSEILKKEFKDLKHYLRGVRARVEIEDRHIIALACQEGAEIHTTDPGIERALITVQTAGSARHWRAFARKVKVNRPTVLPLFCF